MHHMCAIYLLTFLWSRNLYNVSVFISRYSELGALQVHRGSAPVPLPSTHTPSIYTCHAAHLNVYVARTHRDE